MSTRQTRIFIPNALPFDNGEFWVETLVGNIITPLVEPNPALQWFWFSRYAGTRIQDSGDCDMNAIPEVFAVGPSRIYRSLRFRYSVADGERDAFESQCRGLIDSAECCISDFRDYDLIGDLACARFLGGTNTPLRREARAELLAQFLCATCRLFMHTLEGPDANKRYRTELNSERGNNPHGSTFESVHHLFCNIVEPPLHILVAESVIGTNIYRAGEIPIREVKVQF